MCNLASPKPGSPLHFSVFAWCIDGVVGCCALETPQAKAKEAGKKEKEMLQFRCVEGA